MKIQRDNNMTEAGLYTLVSPDSKCEQVWNQQWRNKNEENIGGEDSSLHHFCLSDAEGARLLRVLKHKLSAEGKAKSQR